MQRNTAVLSSHLVNVNYTLRKLLFIVNNVRACGRRNGGLPLIVKPYAHPLPAPI